MTVEQCKYNKDNCYQSNILPIMEELKEIKKQNTDILVAIATLPSTILKEADGRYASKSIEKKVETLETTRNSTMFDIMKIGIQALIALGVAYVALMK